MEKAFSKIGEMTDNIREYINTRIEAVKIRSAEKISALIANAMAGLVVVLVMFFFVLFAGMALAFVVGAWIGKIWAGFLIVAFIFLLAGIIIWTARGKLIRLPLMNAIIRQFNNEEDDEED
jgi:divalent metal cation (Fe/Co/Zn/Cd) transporter